MQEGQHVCLVLPLLSLQDIVHIMSRIFSVPFSWFERTSHRTAAGEQKRVSPTSPAPATPTAPAPTSPTAPLRIGSRCRRGQESARYANHAQRICADMAHRPDKDQRYNRQAANQDVGGRAQ